MVFDAFLGRVLPITRGSFFFSWVR
jgi:hypothetical protein